MRVEPEGPTNSPPIAIIGDAPGADEDRIGRPFVGASGRLLNQMLDNAGISRRECYVTNVAKERPAGNNFKARYYEDKGGKKANADLLACRSELNAELRQVRPKLIIALGEEAFRSTTLEYGVSNWRGTLVELERAGARRNILPTFHPTYVMRVYESRPIVEMDLSKARRYAYEGFPLDLTNFNLNPSFDEVMQLFAAKHPLIAVDLETTYGAPVTTKCIGIAWSPNDAMSIPLIDKGTHYWTAEEEGLIFQSLKAHMLDPEVKKVLQNGPFDTTILEREFGIQIDGYYLDTMFAHHLLYSELPKSLDFQCSIHTDFPMYLGKEE